MLRSFDQVCSTARPDLLIAADSEYAALSGNGRYAMPWHWHDCLMFLLPSQGTIELKCEGKKAGTWLSGDHFAVVPAKQAHETQAGVGAHGHIAIYVTGPTLDRIDKEVGSLTEFRRRTRTTAFFHCPSRLRSLHELSARHGPRGYGDVQSRRGLSSVLLVQCIAEVISGETVSGATSLDHGKVLVEDLKQYLLEHLDETLPLDALSERFGVSRRHMTRMFREFTGSSIIEFQQRVRMAKARKLLSETHLPIGDVAFEVGFESSAALAHAMRRIDGRSPSEIRGRLARSIKK